MFNIFITKGKLTGSLLRFHFPWFLVHKHKFKIEAKQFTESARRAYWLQSHGLIRWCCYMLRAAEKESTGIIQQKQHNPRQINPTRWRMWQHLWLLEHPVILNHPVRYVHHLKHSHLWLTAMICPSHYGMVILCCKGHNSSCSSFLFSTHAHQSGGKRKKTSWQFCQDKVYTDFFPECQLYFAFKKIKIKKEKKKEKIDRIIVLLLLIFSSIAQFTDFGYL